MSKPTLQNVSTNRHAENIKKVHYLSWTPTCYMWFSFSFWGKYKWLSWTYGFSLPSVLSLLWGVLLFFKHLGHTTDVWRSYVQ